MDNAGGASSHHHNTFHGSGPNTATVHRRAVISHLIHADATFHPEHADPVYSRYRGVGDLTMDESFFPVVWTRDAGGWPTGFRTGRQNHDWDPWIVYPLIGGSILLAVDAWQTFRRDPISERDVRREMERVGVLD